MANAKGANAKKMVSIPASGGEAGLNRYLSEIKKFPILAPEEEYMLAQAWREHGDTDAAARLVNSHLRLVAKIAMGYRGYGLPVSELISEGNIGLMQGVKKFEPDRGFRLATYAMWWIRASIQEFILRSWSLVKMGTTAAQKKLFFNLRRMKNQLDAFEDGDLKPADVTVEELSLKRGAGTIAVEVGQERILAIFENECGVDACGQPFCEYGLARADGTLDGDVPELQCEPMISSRRDAFDDRAGARAECVCLRQRSSRDISSSSS